MILHFRICFAGEQNQIGKLMRPVFSVLLVGEQLQPFPCRGLGKDMLDADGFVIIGSPFTGQQAIQPEEQEAQGLGTPSIVDISVKYLTNFSLFFGFQWERRGILVKTVPFSIASRIFA